MPSGSVDADGVDGRRQAASAVTVKLRRRRDVRRRCGDRHRGGSVLAVAPSSSVTVRVIGVRAGRGVGAAGRRARSPVAPSPKAHARLHDRAVGVGRRRRVHGAPSAPSRVAVKARRRRRRSAAAVRASDARRQQVVVPRDEGAARRRSSSRTSSAARRRPPAGRLSSRSPCTARWWAPRSPTFHARVRTVVGLVPSTCTRTRSRSPAASVRPGQRVARQHACPTARCAAGPRPSASTFTRAP